MTAAERARMEEGLSYNAEACHYLLSVFMPRTRRRGVDAVALDEHGVAKPCCLTTKAGQEFSEDLKKLQVALPFPWYDDTPVHVMQQRRLPKDVVRELGNLVKNVAFRRIHKNK